eukprot:2727690-Pyramimonas_sp.AAC.1
MVTDNRQGIAMPSTRLWHRYSGPKPLSHFLVNLRPFSRLPGTCSSDIPGARTTTKPDRNKEKRQSLAKPKSEEPPKTS